VNCPVCQHAVAGRQCANCGARVSADGMWAYRGASQSMVVQQPPYPGPQAGAPPLVYQQPYAQPQAGMYAPGPNPLGQIPVAAPPVKKRRRGRAFAALGAVLLILILGGAAYALTHRGSSAKTSAGPTAVPAVHRNFGPMVAVSGTLLGQLQHVQ
jgi:hypothetical protein